MVLLTSSSISVAISSAVVCIFTFLLFLSGYVLQQQTVRSMQEVLRAPPVPIPTLPVYFQDVANETAYAIEGEITVDIEDGNSADGNGLNIDVAQSSSQDGYEAAVQGEELESQPATTSSAGTKTSGNPSASSEEVQDGDAKAQVPRLAYMQVITKPTHICSSLLFYQFQLEHGDRAISRVILYPSQWEGDSSNEAFANALALLFIAREDLEVELHAVSVEDTTFNEIEIEKQAVAALSGIEWKYERLMYLRIPGLALNIGALDSALQTFDTPASSRNWIQSTWETGASVQLPALLIVSSTGTYSPRGSMRRLISEAMTSHANHHESEMDVEAVANTAAYVHFDEGELEHRRTEKEWYGGVFERYERGRAEVCRGIDLEVKPDELLRMQSIRRMRD